MVQNKARQYLENHILTAPKEQLLLMLFDGAIRFSEQAKVRMDEKDIEGSCKLLIKAQRIIMELITSLDQQKIPSDLYHNLMGLYGFVYFRLVNANLKKETGQVDDALKILNHLRETGAQAVEKVRQEQHPVSVSPEKAGEPVTPSVPKLSIEG